jgi:CrcB protein
MGSSQLKRELNELTLVAAGAIPGALLRWRLESLGGSWFAGAGDLAANLAGCLLLGLLLGRPTPAARLMLWGGIGFCGSLTTFSGWMLELVRALERGAPLTALSLLLTSLLGGLALVWLGRLVGRRWFRPRGRSSS